MMLPTAAPPRVPTALPFVRRSPPTAPAPASRAVSWSCLDIPAPATGPTNMAVATAPRMQCGYTGVRTGHGTDLRFDSPTLWQSGQPVCTVTHLGATGGLRRSGRSSGCPESGPTTLRQKGALSPLRPSLAPVQRAVPHRKPRVLRVPLILSDGSRHSGLKSWPSWPRPTSPSETDNEQTAGQRPR